MAELLIQNPSITTNDFEYNEAGYVSAISGHPLADNTQYIISATIASDTTAYVSAVENNSFIDFGTIPDSVESISLNVLANEIDGKNLVPQFASNVKTTSSSNLTQITLQYNGQTLPAYQMPEAFANSNLQVSLYGLAYIIGQIDLEEMN